MRRSRRDRTNANATDQTRHGHVESSGIQEAAAQRPPPFVLAYAIEMSWFFSGNERMRLPVALKYAFITAGAATQMVGSPMPPHGPCRRSA